jgi:2-dehydro-3-deoxygalactonokinase
VRASIYIDLGTTNTRLWLARGQEILARAMAQVGVRDTARMGSNILLRQTLKSLIEQVLQAHSQRPDCIIAAGMITSSLGLAEVPHVAAPAGLAELAAATQKLHFPDITTLPIFLVPGVRTGELHGSSAEICHADLMRGEETLCLGLILLGLAKAPGIVLNLGSHWKAISLDERGRIIASATSLTGEMIHAAQTSTILASALPAERPAELDQDWIAAGMSEQRNSGLPRAMFCVRLLEQSKTCTAEQRFAFLIGAFIACDLDALIGSGIVSKESPIAIVGNAALAQAWQAALTQALVSADIVTEQQTESALLVGLSQILSHRETGKLSS